MLTSREKHLRRAKRNRAKLRKAAEGQLRLSIARSGKNISAQIIDDEQGLTLAAASTLEADVRSGLKSTANIEAAQKVGALVAERAKAKKIEDVVFDRGGFRFHGRVKALADAAREGGLKF